MEIRFHGLIPPLTALEYSQLERSILAEGCRDALVLWDGVLLDGHNRLRICREHSINFRTIEVNLPDELAAREWVLRNQLGRRNLTPYQLGELKLELEAVYREQAKQRQRTSTGGSNPQPVPILAQAGETGRTRDKIAKESGLSHGTLDKIKYIRDHADDRTKEKLRRGDPEISIHRAYTGIIKDQQEAKNRAKPRVEPPEGTYDVIVIDPPWPMRKIERECRPNQAEMDYPTMTIDEIAALSIPATDNCHLFCWTTQRFLPDALSVIERWGFRYVFEMVWLKPGGFQPVGLPQYNCEFAIYARKGSPQFSNTKAFKTGFEAPRGKHSEKPEVFYEMIRKATDGKRLDMFSRRQIEGFDVWGNEL